MSDQSAIARSLRPRGPISFRLARRLDPEFTLLEIGGEVDLLTASRLGGEIDREVRCGAGDVVVDLRGAEFVDSAGVHILLNAQRRLTRQGRTLAVICPGGPVRRVFELARLIETLGVVESLREYRQVIARRRTASAA